VGHADAKLKSLPVGTTFKFALNKPVTVTLSFSYETTGRAVGMRCAAPTRANRKDHPCTRVVVAGMLPMSATVGANSLYFAGVLSGHRRLAVGKYQVVIAASSSSERSASAPLRFTVAGG
jgi:hypothetical protein